MRAIAPSFREGEEPRGHLVEGADVIAVLEWINAKRRAKGIPALPVWDPDVEAEPETIMWRRGQALGLAPSRNRSAAGHGLDHDYLMLWFGYWEVLDRWERLTGSRWERRRRQAQRSGTETARSSRALSFR